MTSEEARRHLETVNRGLGAAVEQLVVAPSRTVQVSAELAELAQTIKRVYDDRASLVCTDALVCSIRSIQERVSRVQVLLDSAVTFYCGSMATTLSHAGAYTSDGGTPRTQEQGYLRIEA